MPHARARPAAHGEVAVKPEFVWRRITSALKLLLALVAVGTAGYMAIERFPFLDALYMTVITISTVGFHEVRSLSDAGRLFTIFLILSGVGVLFYTLGTAIEYFFGDFLVNSVEERRLARMIANLRDHFIVCGYGRVGKETANELRRLGTNFVLVEESLDVVERAREDGFLVLHGSATDDAVLQQAGIARAKGLVAAIGNDAENVFIVLTARSMNPSLHIVARANSADAEDKLYRAGANRVLSPAVIGGRRLAALLARPRVSEYVDALSFGERLEFQVEEYEIPAGSPLVGRTLGEARVRDETGVVVIALRRPNGEVESAPRSHTLVEAFSRVIVLGNEEQLDEFERKFIPEPSGA